MRNLYIKISFILCALLLGSPSVWGWAGAKVYVYSDPTAGGFVYVNTSNSGPGSYTLTSDQASQSHGTAVTNKYWDFYLFAETNPGYKFLGWATSSGSSSYESTTQKGYKVNKKGTPGFSYTEYKYYARFAPLSYDVTLKANTGSGTDQVVLATYDAAMPLTLKGSSSAITVHTKTGYTLNGYYDAKSGGNKYYDYNGTLSSARTWNKTSNTDLYAQWSANSYTVKFNGNGGSSPEDKSVIYDAKYGDLTPSVRTGYTFAGWWTSATGGTQVTADTKVQITATQTLYAHWTVNSYTITLNNQSATSAGTTSIAVTYDAVVPAITIPVKTHCTFEGYYTAENGDGVQIINNDGSIIANVSGYTDASKNWKYANNLILYAYWKQNQTILWTLADGTGVEYTTGQVMGAVAYGDLDGTPSGLAITYTTSDASVATIVDGKLNVLIPNAEVTIYASQGGNHDYNATAEPPVSKTFTTAGCTPNVDSATALDITYGQTLASSTISGTVTAGGVPVDGEFTWVDPTTAPNAGNEQSFPVIFTPANTAVYGSVSLSITINVRKATPSLTWNITDVLRERVKYGRFVESSNKSSELEFATSNATLLNVNTDGPVLTTGSVDNITDGWIKVRQAASDNYDALDWQTFNVRVYPKNKKGACLPFLPMAGSDYNNALKATVDNVNWCNTNEQGFHDDYVGNVDVYYTQAVGIALGSYEEGLDGLWDAIVSFLNPFDDPKPFEYSTKTVELSFNGIPESISFDVESQTVTSRGHIDIDFLNIHKNIDKAWTATSKNWYLYESADGVSYTQIAEFTSDDGSISRALKEDTRFVKISYHGNFTGYVKNLRITQKKYLREKNNVSALVFGTETKPLQEPQTLTLSYSSLGDCSGDDDYIEVISDNDAFYVDEPIITENVGLEQKGEFVVRVRCNDVGQTGVLTFRSNDGTELPINVSSNTPSITSAGTAIFQTGTEHAPLSGTAYRTQRTHNFEACFNGSTPLFDELYIYGVSESAADSRKWEYSPAKGYKVPVVTASNVHTPCFVYKKDGAQYTYVRTFDAAKTTLNAADSKTRVLVGYRPEGPATTAIQLSAGAAVSLNNTEIVATNAAIAVNGNASIAARGANIVSSASNAAVQLSGAATLGIEDNWKSGEASAVLALRPAGAYPSIDLGSASGRVDINGTQLELHNATNMAIAHMDGTTEKFDGEVHINDGSIGGAETLGMPKLTFIDGGTFNDGTIAAYTLKGVAKRPRNSRGEIVSRHTMAPAALASGYGWYGQEHLTPDGSAKVNPMLMDEEIWIFNGTNSDHSDDATSWNKESVPGENDDVLINAPMVVSGGELKVKSLTINWEDKGKGIPAVTVNPDGGLTVGEGGLDAIKLDNPVENLVLKAGETGETKGQTGFLRIHPNSAEPMPEATVELYSIGYYDMTVDDRNDVGRWQFVGSPLANPVAAKAIYTESFLYEWDTLKGDWVNNRKKGVLKPFLGYSTSQYMSEDGMKVTYAGELVSNEEPAAIELAYNGGDKISHNMLANSFTAPIDITKFEITDFANAEAAIYLFNTGSRNDIANLESMDDGSKGGETFNTPGQYIHIPVGKIGEMKSAFNQMPTSIAPLQGFCVHATGANPKITMDYSKLVWGGDYSKNGNGPLRVAARDMSEYGQVRSLCVTLYGGGLADNLYMLESEENNPYFENGQDARKMMSGALNIFSVAGEDELAVDATNSFIGTRVGVRTGEETMYTMFFTHLNSGNELALLDRETEQITEITENAEYTFFAEPNSTITNRFEIIEWDGSNKPGIATGVENVENGTKVHKFIKDNQLFILKNGVLYNATGVLVR